MGLLVCVICGFCVRYISGREGRDRTRFNLLKEPLPQLEDPVEMAKREEKIFYFLIILHQCFAVEMTSVLLGSGRNAPVLLWCADINID